MKKIITILTVFTVLVVGNVDAHEEDAAEHPLPLQAKIGSVFKKMAKRFTGLFSNKKSNPANGASPAVQPISDLISDTKKNEMSTPAENKSATGSMQNQSPTAANAGQVGGEGIGAGVFSGGTATGGASAKSGGILTPTTPTPQTGQAKSGGEKATGASTVFDGQNATQQKTSEGPITGGGIGQTAPKATVQPTQIILPKPIKLTLETISLLQGVKEIDKITFKAITTMNDGSKKDVTVEAMWSVVGPIGAMEKAGVFRAALDASVSEVGEGFGSIVAGWKDVASGVEFSANSPIFKVEAYYGENLGPQEGKAPTKNFFGNLLKTIMFWK